ncbi:hypothetical protein ACN20G_24085 [Streptomyces sp. BI20]|uniref:hypothetical protein n=1 Tax=Streptomyces sp. BI20 TaxID=3403460 RepID=UPI003C728F51
MPRKEKKSRPLTAHGRVYRWRIRHAHTRDAEGRAADCRQILTLTPSPAGSGGPLRLVFAAGPDRYVPGGAPFGSGDVGLVAGPGLNLHEPGAVRALLDAALTAGWHPTDRGPTELDAWPLLEAALRPKQTPIGVASPP